MPPVSSYTEQELIQALQARSEAAYGYLYDNYHRALFAVIIGMIPQQEVAEEVLQDVFLKIWQNIGSYDPGKGRLYTWMLQITRNGAIDKLRSKEINNRNKTRELSETVFDGNHGATDSIRDAGLGAVLNSMPADTRRLLEMAYFRGYTQEEISKDMNLPLGTVKTRIRTALINLRKAVGIK